MADKKFLNSGELFVLAVSTVVALLIFALLALEQDRLNRRIAALECRAGDVEKCGPPWSDQHK